MLAALLAIFGLLSLCSTLIFLETKRLTPNGHVKSTTEGPAISPSLFVATDIRLTA